MLDSAAVAKICWDSQQRRSVGRFADTETIDKAIMQTQPLQSAPHAYQAPSCHSFTTLAHEHTTVFWAYLRMAWSAMCLKFMIARRKAAQPKHVHYLGAT